MNDFVLLIRASEQKNVSLCPCREQNRQSTYFVIWVGGLFKTEIDFRQKVEQTGKAEFQDDSCGKNSVMTSSWRNFVNRTLKQKLKTRVSCSSHITLLLTAVTGLQSVKLLEMRWDDQLLLQISGSYQIIWGGFLQAQWQPVKVTKISLSSWSIKHWKHMTHTTQPLGGQKLRCEQISLSITSFSDWAFPLHEDTERSVSKGFKARSESSQREWRWTSFSLPKQHVLQRQTSTSTSTIQVKPSVKRYRSVRDYLSGKLLTHQLLSAQHHSPPLYLTCPALPFNSAESKNIDG